MRNKTKEKFTQPIKITIERGAPKAGAKAATSVGGVGGKRAIQKKITKR